jgi:hypothetical protein
MDRIGWSRLISSFCSGYQKRKIEDERIEKSLCIRVILRGLERAKQPLSRGKFFSNQKEWDASVFSNS